MKSVWDDDADPHLKELHDFVQSLTTRVSGHPHTLGDKKVFLKGGPFSKSGAKRHRLRGIFLGAPLPALSEFRALTWLRERLFQAPQPLAALEVRAGFGIGRVRRPIAQLLVTSTVPDAQSFRGAWDESEPAEQARLCRELGTEVGRMHALHFLHADLYPRNVLVTRATPKHDTSSRRLWFIDSWAGGPTAWRNGSLRRVESDLGTWLADFEPGLMEAPLRELLTSYAQAREDNGRPVADKTRWLASVADARRQELRKLERQRYRLRGATFPQAGVAAPSLGK